MLGALTFAVFFFLPFSETLPGAASIAWTGLVFTVMGWVGVTGRMKRPVGGGLWAVALALAIVGFISSSNNPDSMRGHVLMGMQIVLFLGLGPFALSYLASVEKLRAKAVGAFLIGQTVSAAAAIVQASGTPVLGYGVLEGHGRAPGLAGHFNILGVLSGVAIIILLHLIFTHHRHKLLLVLGFAVNLIALFASGSISALIACFVGVLLYMMAARVRMRLTLLIAVASSAALWGMGKLAETGLVRGPMERFLQVTGQTSAASTLDIREHTYAYAWSRIQRDPFFGAGLDDSSGGTYDYFTLTHNVLLRSWFQGGLAMGLAFILIYTLIVAMVMRSVISGASAAPAAALTVIIGFSMTSAALQQGYYWLLMLGACAMIEPATRTVKLDPWETRLAQVLRASA